MRRTILGRKPTSGDPTPGRQQLLEVGHEYGLLREEIHQHFHKVEKCLQLFGAWVPVEMKENS